MMQTIVYEIDWVIRKIYEVSDKIRHKLVDQTLFEDRCIKRVSEYLAKDERNIRNRKYIVRLIHQVASAALTRNKREYAEMFSELASEYDNGNEIDYEPIDVLADVEETVVANEVVKEKVALLAQDDRRKLVVLNAWISGNTNDSDISRTLARAFGGNESGHRSFLKRFRTSCRQRLADVI